MAEAWKVSIAHDLAPSGALITVCGINALNRRTALPSLERKPSVRSPVGGSPADAPREVAFARAVKCLHRRFYPFGMRGRAASGLLSTVARTRWLWPIAPPALDQRVVEHRVVVVLAGDGDDLVPGARMDDSLVVDLGPEALGVDRGQRVAYPVQAASSVAAADDRHEWLREQKLETALPNASKLTSGDVVVHKTRELVQA